MINITLSLHMPEELREITGYRLGRNSYGENTVEVKVKVTNNGPLPGKDVVELFYSQPFYNKGAYGVEKSLINLGAYKKTSLLDAGKSETIKLVLNVEHITSAMLEPVFNSGENPRVRACLF